MSPGPRSRSEGWLASAISCSSMPSSTMAPNVHSHSLNWLSSSLPGDTVSAGTATCAARASSSGESRLPRSGSTSRRRTRLMAGTLARFIAPAPSLILSPPFSSPMLSARTFAVSTGRHLLELRKHVVAVGGEESVLPRADLANVEFVEAGIGIGPDGLNVAVDVGPAHDLVSHALLG